MKMLKITRLALLSFLFSCLALFAAETTRVTNLTATPRTPWNGLVDITYSLECDTPDAVMAVSFQGFDYDRNESIPMTALTGDGAGGELLPAGGPYHIAWDSANDWPEGHSSEFTVTATAEVKETTPLYLVVNLNTGAVTPSTTGPDLSNDTCRTTELWLRRIPKGTFTMGSPEGEVGRESVGNSKETQHQVTLTEDFYIGVFEITQKQYSLIYGSNPSFYNGDTRPVEYVSYNTIRGGGEYGWRRLADIRPCGGQRLLPGQAPRKDWADIRPAYGSTVGVRLPCRNHHRPQHGKEPDVDRQGFRHG